jgi:hypothetical protein
LPDTLVGDFGQPFSEVLDIQECDGPLHNTALESCILSLPDHAMPKLRHRQEMRQVSFGTSILARPVMSVTTCVQVGGRPSVSNRQEPARADFFRSPRAAGSGALRL